MKNERLKVHTTREFSKAFQKNLKDEGIKITLPDAQLISKIFIETLYNDFLAKVKDVTFPRFGCFKANLRPLNKYNFTKDEKGLTVITKMNLSIIARNDLRNRYAEKEV